MIFNWGDSHESFLTPTTITHPGSETVVNPNTPTEDGHNAEGKPQ